MRKYKSVDAIVEPVILNNCSTKCYIFIACNTLRDVWRIILDKNGYIVVTGDKYTYCRGPYLVKKIILKTDILIKI